MGSDGLRPGDAGCKCHMFARIFDNLGTRLSRRHVQLSTHRPRIDD
jgi:hypothetical protein